MKKSHLRRIAAAVICIGLIGLIAAHLPKLLGQSVGIPGLTAQDRVLLRIWVIDPPGGTTAWLKGQLRQFEKQYPGISIYLRTVSPEELTRPDVLLPDVVLYQPGCITSPELLFLPLSGEMIARDGLLQEELLRCGRWQGQQYGLPLCWGAWALAIDSALEPGHAMTPAPTTLLGKPAATASADATPEPGYPLDAAAKADCALQSPGGAALFTLGLLLETTPPLPEDFGALASAEVYTFFQKRQCATAMLTTGQLTAFSGLVSGGSGFPFRTMVSEEIITDQVCLASVTAGAPQEAAMLLSHLTSKDAQKALSSQGLHTVRGDLLLYAQGISSRIEAAAQKGLSAINAYLPADKTHSAAWQFFQGRMSLNEALLPLL